MSRAELIARIQRLLTRYARPLPKPTPLTLAEAAPMISGFLQRLLSVRQ